MMDVFGFMFYRGIERWMVVLGGLIFGYLGYKLFLYGVDEGHGKLNAENQFFKVTFSGSGPGLFFMAFGALILMSSVYSTGTVTHKSLLGDTGQNAIGAASATPADSESSDSSGATETTIKFSAKIGASDCNLIRLSGHDNVRDALEAYGNVENPQLDALAAAMQNINDENLKTLMPVIESIMCE